MPGAAEGAEPMKRAPAPGSDRALAYLAACPVCLAPAGRTCRPLADGQKRGDAAASYPGNPHRRRVALGREAVAASAAGRRAP